MIGRIVITSVPQGLDGGTGFQPVLRTQGLKPSVAERLALRAAYPHPFPFGDPRNPRVLFHRIETLGDRTIHVIGSVRDAGGSYTGRANRLAELIAIDPAETGGLPGGPAFAARGFPWVGRWVGSPRELPLGQEPAIPAVDPYDPHATGRPLRCAAWEKATGDAGWAGELAQSFLDGRRALIWVGEHVDVLELFVEAARLIPTSARWRLTFNTCEIEPFPAHWRAVRPELGLVGNYEPKNELRLVLGKIRENGSRAPDHDLARLARGEKPAQSSQPASQNAQSQHSSFGGHAGSQSPDPDDAALRARLKEISDERRRRPNAGRAGGDATRLPGSHSLLAKALLLGILAFLAGVATVILFLAIQHPDLINRQLRSQSVDNGLSPAEELVATQQQQQSRPPAAPADTAEKPHAAEKERSAAPAPIVPAQSEPIADQRENNDGQIGNATNDTAPQSARAGDESVARTQAFQALCRDRERIVSLFDDSTHDPLVGAPLKEVALHDDFRLVELIDATIDFASPYDGEHRLLVSVEPATSEAARTWKVGGKIYEDTLGVWTPIHLCDIVARDGKLSLKPTAVANPTLWARLRNSRLLISARNPNKPDDNLVTACRITFREPIALPQPYLLDPLMKDKRILLGDTLNSRLDGIDPDKIQWAVQLTHPSLSEPATLNENKRRIPIPLAKPDTGSIEVTYHATENGALRERTASLRLDVAVEFSVTLQQERAAVPNFIMDSSFQAFDDPKTVLSNRIPIETLRRARDTDEWNPINTIILRELEKQKVATDDNRADQKEKQGGSPGQQFASDAEKAWKTLKARKDYLRPIEARITKFEVTASDSAGHTSDSAGDNYSIPIVKPAAD